VIYKDLLDRVAVNHPKTEERINEDGRVTSSGTMVVVPWPNRERARGRRSSDAPTSNR